jgi:hypothetical protein
MTYPATWNVQNLPKVSAVKGLVNEIRKYRIMIAAIQDIRRLELRWLDCTENDMKLIGVKTWRKRAENRYVWAIILKEALVKLGPRPMIDDDDDYDYDGGGGGGEGEECSEFN